jgi:ribose 5-phosphate isomerase B
LPARVVDAPGDDLEIWKSIIDEWIETPFAGAARYVRRNAELDAF